ncbi:hypothetical protein JCM10295v2_001437 [Rhodotorula toruloides]
MASHAATHHATTRIGHTSTLTAILQAHGRFGQIDHAFVGPTDKVHNAQPAASSPRAHLVPHGLEELNLPHKGILSAAAWERDISHLMSAEDYVERAQRLGALLVASEEPAEANEKPVNLLVEQSARMEMVQTGYNPNSRSEESRDLLADLMMGWEQVIKVLKKRFAHAFTGLAGTVVRLYAAQNYLRREGLASAPSIHDFVTRQRDTEELILHVEIAEADLHRVATDIAARESPHTQRQWRAAITIADTSCRFILESFVPHSPHDLEAWPRDHCHIVEGSHATEIPTELAVEAQCNRLTRLTQVSDQRLARGFDRAHPPPVPVDTVSFRAEWLAQEHFDRIGHGRAYYLSEDAWDHDIPFLMPQDGYEDASNRLLFLASKSIVRIGGHEVNLLVDSAAQQEHVEGKYPGTSRERVTRDLEMLKESWTLVLHLVTEYLRRPYVPANPGVFEVGARRR